MRTATEVHRERGRLAEHLHRAQLKQKFEDDMGESDMFPDYGRPYLSEYKRGEILGKIAALDWVLGSTNLSSLLSMSEPPCGDVDVEE